MKMTAESSKLQRAWSNLHTTVNSRVNQLKDSGAEFLKRLSTHFIRKYTSKLKRAISCQGGVWGGRKKIFLYFFPSPFMFNIHFLFLMLSAPSCVQGVQLFLLHTGSQREKEKKKITNSQGVRNKVTNNICSKLVFMLCAPDACISCGLAKTPQCVAVLDPYGTLLTL